MNNNSEGRRVLDKKIVILGHTGVGKTCLVNTYSRGYFTGNTTTTIGAAYIHKVVDVDKQHRMSLQIWDTAGQERFHSMLPMYYRNAHGAILVYDVTDPASMEKLSGWITELHNKASPDLILSIAANKSDLVQDPSLACVPPEEAERFAAAHNATLFHTSAKTGKGIEALFTDLAQKVLEAHLNGEAPSDPAPSLDINTDSEPSGGCPC
jgi:small GTP-binding protein